MQAPSPSIDQIALAIRQQRPQAAEQLAREYLRAMPGDESALLLLGMSLQMQQQADAAIDVFRELTRLKPDSALHWNNLGALLRGAERADAAEEAYRQALQLEPRNARALENLGLIHYDRSDFPAARKFLVAAVELDPGAVNARIYGAAACCECVDIPTAERLVASWWQWTQLDLDPQLALANVMLRSGHPDSAETILRRALTQTADKPRVLVRLLNLYERLNRVDDALALLPQLPRPDTVSDPDLQDEIVKAYSALAARENDYRKARELLEPLAGVRKAGAEVFFALAKVRDKDGDVPGAMQALERAHALQMEKAAKLIPELIEADVDPLTLGLDPVTAESRAQWLEAPGPAAAESPIFIMGFPRSGTTMLEQMLDAVPTLKAMDEQPFLQNVIERMREFGLDYPEQLHLVDAGQCEQLRQVYWDRVRRVVTLAPGQCLVDKNPLNMLRLPLVNRLFPQARIILILRHPCDVVLSCYMQSFGAPSFNLLCSTLPRLARGYVNAFQGWLTNVEILQPRIFELRHEDLLDDFAGYARRIGEFIGVEDTTPMLAFHEHARRKGYIATPSYAQVTEPLNRKGVDRWRRYRAYMEPVLPILRPIMEHWGYAD
jgi:tetratricopeptide (TPR) repeat protein